MHLPSTLLIHCVCVCVDIDLIPLIWRQSDDEESAKFCIMLINLSQWERWIYAQFHHSCTQNATVRSFALPDLMISKSGFRVDLHKERVQSAEEWAGIL